MLGTYVTLYVVIILICAVAAGLIAQEKRRSYYGFLLLGIIFGPLAVLVAVLIGPGKVAVPVGMRAVQCPRCNAEQNIPEGGAREFECWQCKLVTAW